MLTLSMGTMMTSACVVVALPATFSTVMVIALSPAAPQLWRATAAPFNSALGNLDVRSQPIFELLINLPID